MQGQISLFEDDKQKEYMRKYLKEYRKRPENKFKQKKYEINYWRREHTKLKREIESLESKVRKLGGEI